MNAVIADSQRIIAAHREEAARVRAAFGFMEAQLEGSTVLAQENRLEKGYWAKLRDFLTRAAR